MSNRLFYFYLLESIWHFKSVRLTYCVFFYFVLRRIALFLQTMLTLIKRRLLRRLIWVCNLCLGPLYGSLSINGFKFFFDSDLVAFREYGFLSWGIIFKKSY